MFEACRIQIKAKPEGKKKTSGIAGRRCKDEIKRHLADTIFVLTMWTCVM
jgi:hypothetical protein